MSTNYLNSSIDHNVLLYYERLDMKINHITHDLSTMILSYILNLKCANVFITFPELSFLDSCGTLSETLDMLGDLQGEIRKNLRYYEEASYRYAQRQQKPKTEEIS